MMIGGRLPSSSTDTPSSNNMSSKGKGKKNGVAKEKGQTDIACFFLTRKEKEEEKKSSANASDDDGFDTSDSLSYINKENDDINIAMGLDSNLRKSAIQKSREFGTKPAKLKKNSQRTIHGGVADGRCDEGTKVCKACEKLKVNPKFKSFPHDPTCKRNSKYKQTNGGRTSNVQYFLDKAKMERMKALNKPLSGNELFTSRHTQEKVDQFFIPRSKDSKGTNVDSNSILSEYETANLIQRINHYMKHPTWAMRKASTVPLVVAAGIQTLLDLIPVRFKKGTNEISDTDKRNITYKKVQVYRKKFPPGTIGFTFPRADKLKAPERHYCQLEDRTIYFVCWELNIPGWEPTCFECGHVMVHDQYDFQQHGYATPIFDITGVTDYACSMYYNCKKCDNRCKANDGRLFFQLDVQFRNS